MNSGLTQYGDPDIYVNMLDLDPCFNDEESSDSLSTLCALIDFTLEGFGAISVIESNTPVTALCDTWANQISEEVKEGRMSPFDAMFFANIIQVNPPFGTSRGAHYNGRRKATPHLPRLHNSRKKCIGETGRTRKLCKRPSSELSS